MVEDRVNVRDAGVDEDYLTNGDFTGSGHGKVLNFLARRERFAEFGFPPRSAEVSGAAGDISAGEILLKRQASIPGDERFETGFFGFVEQLVVGVAGPAHFGAVRTSWPASMRRKPVGAFSSSRILIRSRAV